MSVSVLLRYLFGNREAILEVAACRQGFFLGACFVLSAGFARSYDDERLPSEPWRVLLPLFASVAAALALYLLLWLIGLVRGGARPGFFSGCETMVQLFWMTAPLAWLYAIPFEMFFGPAEAMRANLLLLAMILAWRVLLMARVVSVLYDTSPLTSFVVVMLFADTLLLGAYFAAPAPIIEVMSGARLSESEQVLQDVSDAVFTFAAFTWPVWVLLAVVAAVMQLWNAAFPERDSGSRVQPSLWILGGMSLVVWALVLPVTQFR